MPPKRTKLASKKSDVSPNEIIRPEDVTTNRELKDYFRQRLGASFNDLDFILIARDAYLRLLQGEHALLAKMIMENEDAASEIFIAYAGDKLNRVLMTFHIESPTVGNRAIEFIKKHKSSREHDEWLTEMENLSFKIQKLHQLWKRQSFRYHKIPLSRKFQAQG